jgi:hypothetical protein
VQVLLEQLVPQLVVQVPQVHLVAVAVVQAQQLV